MNLSSLAGAIGAGMASGNGNGTEIFTATNQGAEIGKNAVEHNFLSELALNRRDVLWDKIQKGSATQEEKLEYIRYETDDHTSDFLVDKAKYHPQDMTDADWLALNTYVRRYINESTVIGDKPSAISQSLKDILNGNYYKGYDYAYALDDKYRRALPSRWSTSGKSEQEKIYYDLKTELIQNPNTIRNSFDGKVAMSTKEALELSSSLYGIGKALQGAKAIEGIMSNSTKFTLGIAGAGSIGGQLISDGTVDPITLTIDLSTAYILKGKGFVMTIGGNAASGGLNNYVTNKSVQDGIISSGLGSVTGYGIGKSIEIPLGKNLPDPTWSKYVSQPISDKAPYIESYRRSIIPSIWGTVGGETGNRWIQFEYNKAVEKYDEK